MQDKMIEAEDGELGEVNSNDFLSNANQTLTNLKYEMITLGAYPRDDLKCHSFQSFSNLLTQNSLFKKLRTDRHTISGTLDEM